MTSGGDRVAPMPELRRVQPADGAQGVSSSSEERVLLLAGSGVVEDGSTAANQELSPGQRLAGRGGGHACLRRKSTRFLRESQIQPDASDAQAIVPIRSPDLGWGFVFLVSALAQHCEQDKRFLDAHEMYLQAIERENLPGMLRAILLKARLKGLLTRKTAEPDTCTYQPISMDDLERTANKILEKLTQRKDCG